MKQKKLLQTIGFFIILLLLLHLNVYSQAETENKNQSIINNLGAGIEYMLNSELGIFGQYKYSNFVLACHLKRCGHVDKFNVTPIIRYYFDKSIYGITPIISVRYGKLHYNKKWLSVGYDYDIVYVWDPAMGQMMPEVRPSYYASSGSSVINTPAISLTGGGEYKIPDIGLKNGDIAVNATVGASYFTKISGDFKDKCKFFFTVAAVYYFGKDQ